MAVIIGYILIRTLSLHSPTIVGSEAKTWLQWALTSWATGRCRWDLAGRVTSLTSQPFCQPRMLFNLQDPSGYPHQNSLLCWSDVDACSCRKFYNSSFSVWNISSHCPTVVGLNLSPSWLEITNSFENGCKSAWWQLTMMTTRNMTSSICNWSSL